MNEFSCGEFTFLYCLIGLSMKTKISTNLHTTRFWHNLHQVRPRQNIFLKLSKQENKKCINRHIRIKLEYTKEKIRTCKSIKDRHHIDKRTTNDHRNTTPKRKDLATQIPLRTGMNSGVPVPLVTHIVFLLYESNII